MLITSQRPAASKKRQEPDLTIHGSRLFCAKCGKWLDVPAYASNPHGCIVTIERHFAAHEPRRNHGEN